MPSIRQHCGAQTPSLTSRIAFGLLLAVLLLPLSFGLIVTDEEIAEVVKKYDDRAGARARAWRELMLSSKKLDEAKKLQVVNNFFNQIPFISDAIHWKQQDYWATPLELLGSNGGDCEDYSIAKYLTLRELGVADGKLRITYVKALKLNEAHMVLTYYSSPSAEPVILDNLEGDILPASQRKDLLPVYSFNGESLWLAKELSGRGQLVGGSGRIALWRDLMKRVK